MEIRPVEPADRAAWERMRQLLWPSEPGEHQREIARFFGPGLISTDAVFLAFDDLDVAIGFAEASIRNYAEGCTTDRVLYLEGWFVDEQCRRKGVGAALIKAVEAWGRVQGCTEFASDTELENEISASAHAALGFKEVDRAICFRKVL